MEKKITLRGEEYDVTDFYTYANEDYAFDIASFDDMTPEKYCNIICRLAKKLYNRYKRANDMLITDMRICVNKKEYIVRVNNSHHGFVSISALESGLTSVSYTEYYPFFKSQDDDHYIPGLINLAEMVNEAWYKCQQSLEPW